MANRQQTSRTSVVREPDRTLPASQAAGPELEGRIRDRAFQLYEARNGQGGSDTDDWLQAEREILAEPSPRAARSAAAAFKGGITT